jgi:hypothetical protein
MRAYGDLPEEERSKKRRRDRLENKKRRDKYERGSKYKKRFVREED